MINAALAIRGLRKRYGKRVALDGLDLEVAEGSLFGLVGSNGAGKTTMMACCAGLLRPDEGFINILGDGPHIPGSRRGVLSILPQDARLPLHARVGELLAFYGRLQGVPGGQLDEEVDRLLGWVNLSDRKRAPVRSLSHGMMRRLTVAQAFIGQPRLVLLDEPMSGLDPREVSRIRDLLVRRPSGQTIIISSHILGELEAICDHVAFVEKGRLVKQGLMSAMTRRHHRFTYRVRGEGWPERELRDRIAGANWTFAPDDRRIELVIEDGALDPVEVNGHVLRILLNAGIGIEEVRRGSDLESEFLSATRPSA